jgi:hypothetical protein|tara:strand:- start:107 stop:1234 length:1128 start_codon:yes stop_codon:yes gene_type:complete
MTVQNNRSFLVFFIFLAAAIYSFLVLNRWIVTDLGLLSYGRVWQLYVSWSDFGFFRRGLVGTLFSETRINTMFESEYVFAFVVHHFAILILSILLSFYCLQRGITNILFLIGLAFSPALIIQSGYTTGALDVFVLLVALINILFVRNVLLFCLLLVVGIFIHELFIFTIPAQLYVFHFLGSHGKRLSPTFINTLPALVSVVAVVVVVLFGKTGLPEESFNAIMQQKLPTAYGQHSLWSGYVEVGSTVGRNLSSADQVFSLFNSGSYIFLLPGFFYILILIARGWKLTSSQPETLIFTIAVLFPLLTAFVATDLHRWVGMSANMALLLTLRSMQGNGSKVATWNVVLCGFCLLAPFGGAELDRPFPLHQFVIEKFF